MSGGCGQVCWVMLEVGRAEIQHCEDLCILVSIKFFQAVMFPYAKKIDHGIYDHVMKKRLCCLIFKLRRREWREGE